ncbi:MAG TPA: NAD(P)-dependent oxidoreductase [Candidatus Acidoferrales bacterium]|nr:NAD(P)-dependent oxidoreductase [Candidatus Acidoferrales bacterium]
MKVLVAGATGAIGRPLIAALIRGGHRAVGMTTTESGLGRLREAGAEGIVANVLDAEAVKSAVSRIRPDAVIDELTSLPRHYTPEAMRAAAPDDRRVRLEGGGNLHNAARAAGAKRYVVQSTGFFYAPGSGLAAETEPLALDASPAIAASVRTYTQIEGRVLGASDVKGVALRYGFFYGPGTYHDPASGSISQQVREQKYPVIGAGSGVSSFVHVEDAASATVAALEAEPGIYNIVDDDACAMARWLPAFALALGAPAPAHISAEEALRTAGEDAVYYALRLRGASNGRAKRQLGFRPRRLEWLSGSETESGAPTHGKAQG